MGMSVEDSVDDSLESLGFALGLFLAVRLLLYVGQVTLSTVYSELHCCFVSPEPCVRGGVKFLFASLWQPAAAQVRSCLLERRHSLVPPVPGLPTLYRKRRDFFQSPLYLSYDKNEEISSMPDMSQEFGPCRSLCSITIPRDVLCILQPQMKQRVAMTVVDGILSAFYS